MEERMRGRAWQKKIDEVRRRNPMCVECQRRGLVKLFDHVDHIRPLTKGGTNEDDNLQGLCKAHHIEKTARDNGWPIKKAVGLDGAPEDW